MTTTKTQSARLYGTVAFLITVSMGLAAEPADAQRERAAAVSYRATRHIPVYREPDFQADRAGVLNRGTRVSASAERRPAQGRCRFWLAIAERSWVCGRHLAASSRAPHADEIPSVSGRRVVPFSYARIPRDGADAFESPEDAEAGLPHEQIPGGWLIRVRQRRGEPFVRTTAGLYLRRSDITLLFASRFQGIPIESPDHLARVAWPIDRRARYFSAPHQRARQRPRRLSILQTTGRADDGFLELADGRWVRESQVARPTLAAPPEGIGPQEPWVDVDIEHQILVAYRGRAPVYATVISSGFEDAERRTPTGIFRVWLKLGIATMDSLNNADPSDDYSVDDIPWVQYFNGSIAFHTAYWHHSFGRALSHGCINLAPLDARWLFRFTSPDLPDGWRSIHPESQQPGTVVQVRDPRTEPTEPPPAEASPSRQ